MNSSALVILLELFVETSQTGTDWTLHTLLLLCEHLFLTFLNDLDHLLDYLVQPIALLESRQQSHDALAQVGDQVDVKGKIPIDKSHFA